MCICDLNLLIIKKLPFWWWWKLGSCMGSRGKHSKDLCMGDCGVACGNRSCPLGFQFLISVHLAMEEVQPCPQQGKNKSQCLDFLLHLKV